MRQKHHTRDILILSFLLAIIMVELLKVVDIVELLSLKLFKVNYSNATCSSFMRPIFDKQSEYDW